VRDAMKHRLVGVAVLIGIGVIMWPLVFDTSAVREISQSTQIPEPPRFERFDVAEPRRPDLGDQPDYEAQRRSQIEDVELDDEQVPDEDSDRQSDGGPGSDNRISDRDDRSLLPEMVAGSSRPSAAVVERDENGLPVMWAVQLGVFGVEENARSLAERARGIGYQVMLERTDSRNGAVYRVFAEPKLERDAAEKLKADMEAKLHIKGYVKRYYP